ncbi:O-methyltransferase [Oceanobacillus iheyensis HTE831]|uniref:O-methyltransferase n=1 Tax=Oceanobacillus iheyensis (strain DSM 14371 / CIP 107618 / JCM 11309 / KCTC 3954 / HTE831) TaxID=221109 RepID=Q8ETG6_OCEIH|nr:O-methyltransferase [Oceanobacillus iheyensis]BAC12251.1 O-methyltransferase [Oceanobacillus iheyensis HTE831]
MKNHSLWKNVDEYFEAKLLPDDKILNQTLDNNQAAGLPQIDVAPLQGKLLYLLTKMKSARQVLEIGTLGGYSSIWFAKAVTQNGKVISLEANQSHAEVARQNIENAGFKQTVQVLVGNALDTLPTLENAGESFDVIFIDADKQNNPKYLEWALRLANEGALLIADNVVRNGEVIDQKSEDERIQGLREFVNMLENEERIESTAIQTVGSKDYDGFVIGIVK